MIESSSGSNADNSGAQTPTDAPHIAEGISSEPGEMAAKLPAEDAPQASAKDSIDKEPPERTRVFSRTTSSELLIDHSSGEHRHDPPQLVAPKITTEVSEEEAQRNIAAKEEIRKKEQRRKDLRLLVTLGLVIVLASVTGLFVRSAICKLSPEIRVFAGLLAISLYLVAGGLASIMFVIPAAGPDYEVKTEFYSVRAAYMCVIAGLVLAVIVSVGMILGGLHVFGTR
jgi:hypothetical protein